MDYTCKARGGHEQGEWVQSEWGNIIIYYIISIIITLLLVAERRSKERGGERTIECTRVAAYIFNVSTKALGYQKITRDIGIQIVIIET